MLKRMLCLTTFVVLGLTQIGVSGDIPDLAAWWALDDGSGTSVLDSSGNDHHGEAYGDPAWVAGIHGGALEFDGVDDRVEMPTTSESQGFPSLSGEVTWAVWFKTSNAGAINSIITMGPAGAAHVQGNRSINIEAAGDIMIRAHGVGALTSRRSAAAVADGEWHHVAVTLAYETDGANDTMKVYIDGDVSKGYETTDVDVNLHSGPGADFIITLGARGSTPFMGLMDDAAVFARALSAAEILTVMAGRSTESASGAEPEDGAVDVLRGTVLTWGAGEFAATHDVYFGTAFDDVNNATVAEPLGVQVSQGQTDASYDAGILEFGQTYFWRVDEVNGAPDKTVFKGDVWRFEVEPFAIPVASVTVTASSAHDADMIPEKTIDGSGLSELDQHSTEPTDMWLSGMADPTPTIQYEFDRVYKLHEMWVWNSNQLIENFVGLGAKDVAVEISTNGTDWTALEDVPQFAQAPGKVDYTHNTTIGFGGAQAKYVRLAISAGFGMLPQYGLSEVRFFHIPTLPRQPQPADAEATDSVDVILSWRAGREAASHEVYLGTDSTDLTLVQMTSENSAATGPLNYATTYYWQIVEVNDAEDPAAYAGDVWSFSTPPFSVVDNFDLYNDDCNRIFFAWLDGLGHNGGQEIDDCDVAPYSGNGSGSIVGHATAPFAERSIVYAGNQSMPLEYDSGMSETTIALDPQDWTSSGIQTLSLQFYGAPDNTGQLYVKINNTKVVYEGLADALQRQQWIPWNIDLGATGASLTNVTSLTLGIENASAIGMLYVDEIRVYPLPGQTVAPVLPDDSDPNLAALYEFEGNANDSTGNYPGTAEGDPAYIAGKIGQAISLDNVDDHVVHAFDQDVVWPAYTVTLWVRTDVFNQDIYSGLFNNNSASSDFQIEMNGSDNYVHRGALATVLGPVSSDWVHLAATCDGTQTRLYYNGLWVNTVNAADTNFGQIAVGINRGMSNRAAATIDEVRVYNRALSAAEVAGLAGLTGPVPLSF